MDEQVEQAVRVALDPAADPSLKKQAMQFCEQVKASPDGWQVCLALFTKVPKASEPARFFALQTVNDALEHRRDTLGEGSLEYIRTTLLNFVNVEFVSGSGGEDPAYLRNKLAQSFSFLFIAIYPTSWRSFFADFLSLSVSSVPSGRRTNPRTVNFFLRILLAINVEIADALFVRSPAEVQRNNAIKDVIRDNDVTKVTTVLRELMLEYQGSDDGAVQLALQVIGSWISWIDINLVVNESYMNVIFNYLLNENLRSHACEALVEIVGKKMLPPGKLELISLLNLTTVMNQLDTSADPEFSQHVARLANIQGVELARILEDGSITPQAQAQATALLQGLFPFLLRFLSDEYDETSMAVYPFVTDLLAMIRKEKKRGAVDPAKGQMLGPLLSAMIQKLRYDDESEWGSEADADEEAEFRDMRSKIKIFQETVATIDPELFNNAVYSVVSSTLGKPAQSLNWRDLECALFQLYSYSECIRGAQIYVKSDQDPTPTQLGGMMAMLVNSDVATHTHPSIFLQFMEIVVRYVSFFQLQSAFVPKVLEIFIGPKGLHNENVQVRTRAWYLFYRFVKSLKNNLGNIAEVALTAMGDLLVVTAELPSEDLEAENEMSADAATSGGSFESQLYLFESAGLLISDQSVPAEQQLAVARKLLAPLFADIQQRLAGSKTDQLNVLQVHHDIMAIGTFCKGFPETMKGEPATAEWATAFLEATEVILVALQTFNTVEIVRDASRFAFARLVSILGSRLLPETPRLINGLLTEAKTSELVDFLPFLGQLIHKFQPHIFDMLNNLLMPLLGRIFSTLNNPAEGTDALLKRIEMRKAYLNFILAILNNRLGSVFVSETNQGNFESIIQSIVHFGSDVSDAPTAKLAFGVLTTMVATWGGPNKTTAITNQLVGQDLPGFQRIMYEIMTPVCFEVPSKPEFNPRDAQAQLLLFEIASLQKAMFEQKGDTFIVALQNYLVSINFPQPTAAEYIQSLRTMDLRDFRKFFYNLIIASRG
ncbi:Xpo1-domain-containing protein [Saitoella complicata NRRL Y-17804]|uniref:Xpo1-domain-containing protein n=1 Tax=Saitoella complicata (strain BCRC 22490 / CBS 7301 / JCM 7358 / NBRC 10748 / NRRL Y-17804) TaxID=698492 RepID=UPI000866885C|nr:Xpo1-domain-containing protein [Saitoella complicata NRRL Y-17804]ODQ51343.1 Xpo1-domain-containing protein [Saitoella complicata NRRL Y-17804]